MTLAEAVDNLRGQQDIAERVARCGNDPAANIWRDKAVAIRVVLAALPQAMRDAA